jgi:hypothetical protein
MSDIKITQKSEKKRKGKFSTTPSPSTIGTRPKKGQKNNDLQEEAWPTPGGNNLDLDALSEKSNEMEDMEVPARDDRDIVDIREVRALIQENKCRMGNAEPWACGLVSIIGKLCDKVEQLEIGRAHV